MAELSTIGYVTYQGAVVLFATSIKKGEESGDNPVKTNVLGLAGYSDGAEMASMSVGNAVPQGGYEIDWSALCRSHTTIDLGFVLGGQTTTIRGRLLTVETSTAPDAPNAVDFTFGGRVVSDS